MRKRLRIRRTRTVNPTTVLVELDEDRDVILTAGKDGTDGPLAMSRDEARKLADLLTLVAEG